MGTNSKIEWCDHTFNPWIGCTNVSPGCDHCYAEAWAANRLRLVQWGNHPRKRTTPGTWALPVRWNKAAREQFERIGHEYRPKVFCASLADIFDNQVPPEWRRDLFDLIAATSSLDWLLLTKRPQNITKFLPYDGNAPWPNVWLGATVENQEEADRRIPHLLAVPAAKHFLSCEPLLGSVDLFHIQETTGFTFNSLSQKVGIGFRGTGINWIIAGGESGPNARPMHPDWARSLRDQCTAAGVPFFFKQWGEWLPGENHGEPDARWQDGQIGAWQGKHREWRHFGIPGTKGAFALKVGKETAGAQLDGREWREFPQ